MLLVYTPIYSPRVAYICQLLIEHLAGFAVSITTDRDFFTQSSAPKLQYTTERVDDSPFIQACGFLFEETIFPLSENMLKPIKDRHLTGLFTTDGGWYRFDVLASAFYFVSFYEQYFSEKKDQHGRFLTTESWLYKNKLLHQAVVHRYALDLRSKLHTAFPQLACKKNKFAALNSIDVDMAFSYKGKGLLRNMGGAFRDFFKGDVAAAKKRLSVLLNKSPDPFDTFTYLLSQSEMCHIPTRFFWLMGDHSQYDKNTAIHYFPFQQLIQKIVQKTAVGIHFSYNSHKQPNGFLTEKKRLENIAGRTIDSNRFHYLKYTLPDSFNKLKNTGILHDYSIGSAGEHGFVVGMAAPFYFFDLKKNEASDLILYPFQCMDVTFHTYQKKSPTAAMAAIQQLIDETVAAEGLFVSIWHNNSLCEAEEWMGWRAVYEFMLAYLQKQLSQ